MDKLRRMLKRSALYRRFEWSALHRKIISWRNPAYEAALAAEVEFYRAIIGPGDLVFDVGANQGSKAEVFLRLGARVVAVEPDAHSCRILRRRFSSSPRFVLAAKAVGAACSILEFYSDRPGSAYNTLSTKWRDKTHRPDGEAYLVEVTRLDDLIETYGVPRFLKIDVEGYEWEALQGLNRPVPAISIEANLPEFAAESLQCVEKLDSLDPRYRFGFFSDLERGWEWPLMTADEARSHIETFHGYCEIFAVSSRTH